MAKLLCLTDRNPDDPEWKGALVWQIVLALAEAHHQVMVATCMDPATISITHPRLQITRPVTSWRVDQLPKLTKLILTYRPQIIHTFAPQNNALWSALSVWPYLHALCQAFPIRRYVTLFEDGDHEPPNADCVTVFSEHQKTRLVTHAPRAIEVLPLELPPGSVSSDGDELLIPAPADEWSDPAMGLRHLAEYLRQHASTTACIVGGWGRQTAAEKRQAWQILGSLGPRVSLTENLSWEKFIALAARPGKLWLEPLQRNSWRFLLCAHWAAQVNKRVFTSHPLDLRLPSGSTANSLSRLYNPA